MSLKEYFSPQTIKRFSSSHNAQIELVRFSGSLRLDMGGLTQSGTVIERIWHHAFKHLLPQSLTPKKVLLLGFGAGSSARLIHRLWPKAQITGVDIDPTVIKIAKQYFKITEIPDLKLIHADAYDFVFKPRFGHYDLTLIDCYLGDKFPKKLESFRFLDHLLSHSTHLLINRLFWGKYQSPTLVFRDHLASHYVISTTRTPSNFLLSLKRHPG